MPAWMPIDHRRQSAGSRNSLFERLDLGKTRIKLSLANRLYEHAGIEWRTSAGKRKNRPPGSDGIDAVSCRLDTGNHCRGSGRKASGSYKKSRRYAMCRHCHADGGTKSIKGCGLNPDRVRIPLFRLRRRLASTSGCCRKSQPHFRCIVLCNPESFPCIRS